MRPVFVMALAVAFVGLSLVADNSAMFVGLSCVPDRKPRFFTGTVTEWRAGEYIAVAGQQTNPSGFEIGLRPDTAYEGNGNTIKPGVRVTVWYRNVSERRLMADRVRVLDAAPR